MVYFYIYKVFIILYNKNRKIEKNSKKNNMSLTRKRSDPDSKLVYSTSIVGIGVTVLVACK